jgi:NADH:ubiquinone oxidoreductase subunit
MSILSEIFSWWGGNTWGTRVTIWRQGRLVGSDELGNRYYVQKRGVGPLGVPRRWVIYKDLAEASKVTPDWHGWLHYTVDAPPTATSYTPRPWQKPHSNQGRAAARDRRLQAVAAAVGVRAASRFGPQAGLGADAGMPDAGIEWNSTCAEA